jgi:hypothetical protein
MMRRILRLAMLTAAALAIAAGAAVTHAKEADEETPEQYPAGPHRDDTFYFCTACHGFKIVAAQAMSRPRWDESLDWMVKRHNMPLLEGEVREQILDYLSTAFPERARAPGGWKNPFAPQ